MDNHAHTNIHKNQQNILEGSVVFFFVVIGVPLQNFFFFFGHLTLSKKKCRCSILHENTYSAWYSTVCLFCLNSSERSNVALFLLCTYEKTNGFLSPTEFLRCFRSHRRFHVKGVKGPPPLYSEMYTT